MKRMTIFSCLLIVLAMLLAVFFTASPPASAQAGQDIEAEPTPWYSASWHYRRLVTINSSSTLSNYQVLLTISASNFTDFANTNDNGTDLRITKADGLTLLPFWVESWDKVNQVGYVWVKVDALVVGSTYVYLYYGNTAAASASDGTQTFDFFDDNWCQFPTSGCSGNPVHTATQSWWEANVSYPMVFEDTSFVGRPRYHMLYDGHVTIGHAKGYAWSSDLKTWTEYNANPYPPNPIMGTGFTGNAQFAWGDAIKVGSTYYMFPSRGPGSTERVQSTDLINWTNFTTLIENDPGGTIGTGAAILKEPDGITPIAVDSQYWMVYFHGGDPGTMFMASTPASGDLRTWTYASSWSLPPSGSGFDAGGLWTPSFIRFGDMYYIYYQGSTGSVWETGYARASATYGGNPVAPNSGSISWSKSDTNGDGTPDSVLKRGASGWDSSQAIDPMVRQFSNGVYYLFYTGNVANGYATASSPAGPWTKYAAPTLWSGYNAPTISGGVASFSAGRWVRSSLPGFNPSVAIGFRASYPLSTANNRVVWGGFITGTTTPFSLISTRRGLGLTDLYHRNLVSTEDNLPLGSSWFGSYYPYELRWTTSRTTAIVNHSTAVTLTTVAQIPTGPLPAEFYNLENTGTLYVDWVYVRQYRNPEPSAALGTAESCMRTAIYVDDGYAPGWVDPLTWNCDAFSSLQTALDTANTGSSISVNVAAGTYAESVTLNRNAAVSLSGDITINGSLAVQAGTFNASSGILSIGGGFTHSGGTFNHGSGTLVFTGAGTQNLTLSNPTATEFHNLTVNTGVILSETVSANNATVEGTLTNSGTIQKSQAVAATGPLTFGLTGVTINVTDLTGAAPLTGLRVERIDQNSPHGTSDTNGWGTNTGRYWTITPTGSNYTVNLTLPHTLAVPDDASVCRYDGIAAPGYHWSCARTISDATTVTRDGITQLSEWTVGNHVGPTAVNLISLKATSAHDKVLQVTVAVALVTVLVAGILFWRRKLSTEP